ncbi:MAG: PDZ domain-containing protein [Proteobacteria bacterium]|nr:PDZ domain-containing protein [Pseudomonadota bacterium]
MNCAQRESTARLTAPALAVAAVLLLGGAGPKAAQATDFFVARNGDDANPGTLAKPFATLQRAQRAARTIGGREAVTVSVRTGTYYLPETLVIAAEDSGTKSAPVIYQAHQQEKPVISGGIPLTGLRWEPHQNGILKAKVPTGFATDQLFVNGDRQPMARYPNFDPTVRHFNGWAKDAFSPERAARWKDPAGGFIHALHSAEWGGMHYVITGKGADNQVTYEGGWQNNRPAGMHAHRFVENIFEELDAPGEWFLDARNSLLYFYPPAGLDLATATIEAVRLRHLVELRGTEQAPVRFVQFRRLTFRHAARTFMENKEPLVRSDWTTYRGGALFLNGTEDCSVEDCFIDQVGGNAVFVNNYNRRVTVRDCHIARAGANGVAFVGDREAARVPRDWKDRSQSLANLDRTPGPKSPNYPADCLVDNCLIYLSGRVEKQTAPVQIELSQGITVRHCSLYDVPRAGINIGDGCWGGHVIEFCDIFDTVKETGDHGSFNSWGRDRFWGLAGLDLNNDRSWVMNQAVVLLDAVKTTILRNNRWRCDHGWDVDLDDGSSNYHIYNNIFLNGGLKNREGFHRVVENNVMANNGFHPHVWYKHSGDVVRRNLMWTDHYLPAGGMPATPWGQEMDYNLVHREGMAKPEPATKLAGQSKRDEHSIVADALFIDAPHGDFRVKEGSPALKLGFVNFPMDQFGVQKPELKALARTPEFSPTKPATSSGPKAPALPKVSCFGQALVRDISGLGDRSAYGLPGEFGVLLVKVAPGSEASQAGLQSEDVIIGANGKDVRNLESLYRIRDLAAGQKLSLAIIRKQQPLTVGMTDYSYLVVEAPDAGDFKTVTLVPAGATLAAKASAGGAPTHNDPIESLVDGKIAKGYGPVFGNGVENGFYKLDLAAVKSIARINSFSVGSHRARQNFVLYGSQATTDPGWNVTDEKSFTPLISVDTRRGTPSSQEATSIRRSEGRPLGRFRWLVWAVSPVTDANRENASFQELQVIPAGDGAP